MPLASENILKGALNQDLELCIVVGYNKERDLYVASTTGDTGEIFRTLQTAFKELAAQ